MTIKKKSAGTKQNDGGYFAIKGFLYQFDKTLIEVLTNKDRTISFENQQDIDYDGFVLQVKHKETQEYAPNKIRKAVGGLIELFSDDTSQRFCLYCYFKDTSPRRWRLTPADLNSVISSTVKLRYSSELRNRFAQRFIIQFSDDYEAQFEHTLALIKSSFSLPQKDTAILYHSIFRSKLLDLCVKSKPNRKVCFADLKGFLDDAEVTVFSEAYLRYLGAEKYLHLIKKSYFTLQTPNIENYERLFLIECDAAVNQSDLIQISAQVAKKYYKEGKSPQPYIIFRKLIDSRLNDLKRALFDARIPLFDGTYFDGDRFRVDELHHGPSNGASCKLKMLGEHQMSSLMQNVQMKEVFQFFIRDPLSLTLSGGHRRIQIERTDQILQMIK